MAAVVKVEGVGDFYVGQHAITAKVGTWGAEKQPVVYLTLAQQNTMPLGYETLTNLIDLLCKKKEELKHKMLRNVEENPGKSHQPTIGKRG